MNTGTARSIMTPENEFLEHEPELFNLYLKMPVQFKGDWRAFKKKCAALGTEFEDVLGDLIRQFNCGEASYRAS